MVVGFTLTELIIVLAIIIILALAALPIYGNFQVLSQLNETTSQIIQNLRLARERSLAGYNNEQHAVQFLADKYVLSPGSTYERQVTLASSLSLSTTLTNDDVYFSKGLGVPDDAGIITLTHSIGQSRQIEINSFGLVEEVRQ